MVKTNQKLKQQKVINDDMIKVRNLVILLIIVILVCLGIYFLTDNMINRETKRAEETSEKVEIDYDIASIGTMFNRIEDTYYVLLYSTKNDNEYKSLLTTYRSSDNYIKTYFVDLDKKINESAVSDTLNKRPTNSSEVKVKGATLYKIKDGKVVNCYDSYETIKDVLK